MKKSFTFILLAAFCFLFTAARAQVPTPLDSSDFPRPLDSIFIKTSKIPPTESFSDSISANDTLSIDRCLQKAIQSLGDTYMANIQTGGSNLSWTVVTFYYTSLPNPNNWKKIWYAPNAFVPGATSFPSANVYYQGITAGKTTYNFFRKANTGFYELGSRVMDATPYNTTNSPEKPMVLFPVDYNSPSNIVNQNITTSASMITTSTRYSVTVDAYGTLTLVTGTIPSPVYTDYPGCIRTMTYSIDTMDATAGMLFFLETKIYNWYAPGIFEPIVTYSVSQVRNNIDPLYWSIDPTMAWHDEIEMSFVVPYSSSAGMEQAQTECAVSIIPNFSTGPFTLLMDKPDNKKIEIYNTIGQRVLTASTASQRFDFNLGKFNKGVYMVNITMPDGQVVMKKIILE